MTILYVGIDLAKSVFAVHGVNEAGKPELISPKVKVATVCHRDGSAGKNDAADAAAICEAVQHPNMRFVPIKSLEQQSQLSVHRVRQAFVEQRTATINRIRGLLSEFGVVLPLRASIVRRQAPACLEDLPGWSNPVIGDVLSELAHLDERIAVYDHHVAQMAREDSRAQHRPRLRGIGQLPLPRWSP